MHCNLEPSCYTTSLNIFLYFQAGGFYCQVQMHVRSLRRWEACQPMPPDWRYVLQCVATIAYSGSLSSSQCHEPV